MENSHRQPVHPSFDEGMITVLVHAFYAKVRVDPEIGPVFTRAVGDDWDGHLAKMCDFWSSVMLMTGRYKGNPMIVHMRLKMLQPQHFERWLTLFRLTAEEVCPHEIAVLFIGRAENIARSLQLGMFYRPKLEVTDISVPGAPPSSVR
jgi:hemoglobin